MRPLLPSRSPCSSSLDRWKRPASSWQSGWGCTALYTLRSRWTAWCTARRPASDSPHWRISCTSLPMARKSCSCEPRSVPSLILCSGACTDTAWGCAASVSGARVVWGGLAGAAVFHGVFNILVFSPAPWFGLILIAVGGVGAYRLFKWGQSVSPFRYQRNVPLTPCIGCGQPIRVHSTYCRLCGVRQSETVHADLICGNCRHANRHEAIFCTNCGDKLLT